MGWHERPAIRRIPEGVPGPLLRVGGVAVYRIDTKRVGIEWAPDGAGFIARIFIDGEAAPTKQDVRIIPVPNNEGWTASASGVRICTNRTLSGCKRSANNVIRQEAARYVVPGEIEAELNRWGAPPGKHQHQKARMGEE